MDKKHWLTAVVVAVLGAAFAVVAEAQSRNDAIRLFKEADELYVHAKSTEDMQIAVDKYKAALEIFEKEPYLNGIVGSANNLSIIYRRWGQYKEALRYLEKSLAVARKLNNSKTEAQALGNMAIVYSELGSHEKALDLSQQSLSSYRKISDPLGEAEALHGLGYLYYYRGDYPKAVGAYEAALAIYERLGEPAEQGKVLNNIGDTRCRMGRYAEALDALERAQGFLQKARNEKDEGAVIGNIGEVYENVGLFQKAKEEYLKALQKYRSIKDARAEAETLLTLGNVHKQLGQYDHARRYYEESLNLRKKTGLPIKEAHDLVGNLDLDTGRLHQAEQHLIQSGNNASLGRLYLLRSQYPQAKDYYEKAVIEAERTRNAQNLLAGYTGLGMVHEAQGNLEQAVQAFRKAVQATEETRSSLTEQQRKNFFSVKVGGFLRTEPYKGLARVLMKMKRPDEALKASEYAKARLFGEELARRSGDSVLDLPASLAQQDADLNNRVATLKRKRQDAYEKQNQDIIQTIDPQIREAEAKREAHIAMLRREHPLFGFTKYPQPMDIAQTALQPNEWVIAYDVTDTGILIYLANGKRIVKSLFNPVARDQLENLVRSFRAPMDDVSAKKSVQAAKAFDLASGKKLADLLLGDILSDAPPQAPIVVVPDQALGLLPFEMLPLNSGGAIVTDGKHPRVSGVDFFGQRNPIRYYQSITALTILRQIRRPDSRADRILVMADPVFEMNDERAQSVGGRGTRGGPTSSEARLMASMEDARRGGLKFPRLLRTRELAESLRTAHPGLVDIYMDFDAGKRKLLEMTPAQLSKYRALVIATHGYFGSKLPGIMEPVLVLSLQPPDTDGYLKMSEVIGLKLNANVAALTACRSGLGHEISGEGTMNMGRAFMSAGALSVLMSLWDVHEEASVKLVQAFFENLKEGKNKLESLALARNKIRAAGFDHPYFWAAFILVGEID